MRHNYLTTAVAQQFRHRRSWAWQPMAVKQTRPVIFVVTRLDAMLLWDPSSVVTCIRHIAHPILQIFSVKLAKTPVLDGSVELYGYIAARDLWEPLLNCIVNICRDDSIIVEQVHFRTCHN